MSDQSPPPSIGERLVRLEGKLDAYAAGQSARLDEHDRRLSGHDSAIGDLRVASAAHVTRDELSERLIDRPGGDASGRSVSPWIVAGIILAGLALAAPALSSLITLIDKIAN